MRPGNGRTSERSLAWLISTAKAEEGLGTRDCGGLNFGGVVFAAGLSSGDV